MATHGHGQPYWQAWPQPQAWIGVTVSLALWLTRWLAVRLAEWLDGWVGCVHVWLAVRLAACLALLAGFLGGHGHGRTSGVLTACVQERHAD